MEFWERKANDRGKKDSRITGTDLDDAPELTDEWFDWADLSEGWDPLYPPGKAEAVFNLS